MQSVTEGPSGAEGILLVLVNAFQIRRGLLVNISLIYFSRLIF